MKKTTTTAILFIAMVVCNPLVLQAQWGGSTLLTGDTYRTGNVGIGTTTPTEKLEINTGNIFLNSISGQFIRWNAAGIAPPSFNTRSAGTKLVLYPQIGLTESDYAIGIDHFTLWQGVPGNNASYSHKFYGGTTPLMTIRGDGNVGIGTVSPSNIQSWGRVLDVAGVDNSKILATSRNATYRTGIFSHDESWYGGGGFIGTESNHNLHLITGYSSKVTILTNGNVGIGTTNPLVKMHVNNGGLMISGPTPGYGGPQLIFSPDINTSPNGKWAIEYMSADASRPSMGGLNFWKPSPDTEGAGNYSLFLKDDGKIGMGVTDDNTDGKFCASALPNGYRLYVNGGILTTKVKVSNYCSANWADYVFADDYQLKPLSEVEAYIKENKHLPNIPSAQAIEDEGLDLAEIASKQMEKIEEVTLYLIQMEKDIKQLKAENAEMKAKLSSEKH